MTRKALIIAEAGVNHDGSLEKAYALIDAAARAGADVVKFQTFRADALAAAAAPKAAYQERHLGAAESQRDMLRRLELPREAFPKLMRRAADQGIEFLSTPFDQESLAFLISLGLKRIKIGSGDMTNALLLLDLSKAGCEVILSTGMADMEEVEAALGVLAFGYTRNRGAPGTAAFRAAWADQKARDIVTKRVTLLQCTTDYPCAPEDANLRAMDAMAKAFGLPVGFSDHTDGIAAAIAAVALGARVIEKHITLDRSAAGPDHAASVEPDTLREMIMAIRIAEAALGDGQKVPRPSELANRPVARKSVVAARPIAAGEVFSAKNLTVKRPGGGMSPMDYWDILGRSAERGYAADEAIDAG